MLRLAAEPKRWISVTEGAEIHWGDESGLRSDDVRGRGFAPKGQTSVVRVNNKRHGLSVISTVTNKGQMRWRIFDGALNTTILIDFLRRLIRGQTRKLFLILDNLRVQHAKQVKAWLAEHAQAIEVFYLPSYSPELNPDEMANADIKQAVTKQAPARTKLQLVKGGCGRKLGLPGGSTCIRTKTGFERSSSTSSLANGWGRPSASWVIRRRTH